MAIKMTHAARAELTNIVRKRYHYCPVNSAPIVRRANANAGLHRFAGVHDLNFKKNRMIETKGFY